MNACSQHFQYHRVARNRRVSRCGNLPTKHLIDAYVQSPGSILSVMEVAPGETQEYGMVRLGQNGSVLGLVEKPKSGSAPSNLASVGRYLLEPNIFDILRTQSSGYGGEIQLADAINTLAEQGGVRSLMLQGRRYDCGSKLGYLTAILDFALEHPDFATPFGELVSEKAARRKTSAVASVKEQ